LRWTFLFPFQPKLRTCSGCSQCFDSGTYDAWKPLTGVHPTRSGINISRKDKKEQPFYLRTETR
jgi:hypothetical protein